MVNELLFAGLLADAAIVLSLAVYSTVYAVVILCRVDRSPESPAPRRGDMTARGFPAARR